MSPFRLSFYPLLMLLFTVTYQQDFQPYVQNERVVKMGSRFGIKYDEALEAIFSVAIRLEALLAEMEGKHATNFMVSPLSMAVAVGELILGARGKLQEQLYDLLVIDNTLNRSESVRHIYDNTKVRYYALHEQLGDLMQTLQKRGEIGQTFSLKTASVLFKQNNLTINENYRVNVQKFYGTEIREIDFANNPINAEKTVNQWAINNTNGLIRTILPGPVSPRTVAILANAVYFKGYWEVPFSSQINRIGKFYTTPNTFVNVTYMMGEFENYKFINSKQLNCKMVIIPYLNNELSMYILVPTGDNYNINKFTSDLRTNDIFDLIQEAKQRKVFMMLPKMSLSNTISVLGPLKKYHSYRNKINLRKTFNNTEGDQYDRLDDRINFFKNLSNSGLSDRYSETLDLGGISSDPRFYLSDIYQQMTLSVNEQGTEAAAVAASAIDYIADSVSMRVDRPFLFFIRHEETEATLFWGTIGDPTEKST